MSHVAGARVFQVAVAAYPTIHRITQSCMSLEAITRALPLNRLGAPEQH